MVEERQSRKHRAVAGLDGSQPCDLARAQRPAYRLRHCGNSANNISGAGTSPLDGGSGQDTCRSKTTSFNPKYSV